jgi:hypothetical protein
VDIWKFGLHIQLLTLSKCNGCVYRKLFMNVTFRLVKGPHISRKWSNVNKSTHDSNRHADWLLCVSHSDKKNRLRVCENRVLRRNFGPKGEEVAGGCRTLHNEEFHNLHASPNIIRVIKLRKMRWVGHVARKGKPERKRPLGRSMRRWEDDIKMAFTETGREGVELIHLDQDKD